MIDDQLKAKSKSYRTSLVAYTEILFFYNWRTEKGLESSPGLKYNSKAIDEVEFSNLEYLPY